MIEHLPPHIHAQYNEHEALIEIKTKKLYAGYLPIKQFKKTINYVEQHEGILLETFYKLNENLRPT